MSVFFMVELESITDEKMYSEYIEKTTPIIKKYGGEYVLRSQCLNPISGDWNIKRIILIRFASKDKMQDCFQSNEYKEIVHLRENSSISKAIVIEENC